MAKPMKTQMNSSVLSKGSVLKQPATRVLIVEDDFDDFYTAERLLNSLPDRSYQIVHVDSYSEAVRELQEEVYDVVLLDYYITGGSAKDVFTALGNRWTAPVIIFTGSDEPELEGEMLEAGAFDFLKKAVMTAETLAMSFDFAIRRYAVEGNIRDQRERYRRNCQNAEAAHFSKSEFLSYLGNEIKTPLNAITGFSRVMKDGVQSGRSPEELERYSRTIYDSSRHLLNMIDDLLDLADTDADSFDARHERFKRFRTWIMDNRADDVKRPRKTAVRARASNNAA